MATIVTISQRVWNPSVHQHAGFFKKLKGTQTIIVSHGQFLGFTHSLETPKTKDEAAMLVS